MIVKSTTNSSLMFCSPILSTGHPNFLLPGPNGPQLSSAHQTALAEGLVVITLGKPHHELSDPSEYYVRDRQGQVAAAIQTGTGNKFIESQTLRGLASGTESFRVRTLELFAKLSGQWRSTHKGRRLPWDLVFVAGIDSDSSLHAYAGVMTQHADCRAPKFPRDNHLREIHVFSEHRGQLRDLGPLIPRSRVDNLIWIGHCYGARFVREDNDKLYIVYEKVVEQSKCNGRQVPTRTDLFRREMLAADQVHEKEELVLSAEVPVNLSPYKSVRRLDGSKLLEGLTVSAKTQIRDYQKVSHPIRVATWSAGDFRGDYGAYVGEWEDGRIRPHMNATNDDFSNVLKPIATKYRLRGAGRLSFVTEPDGALMRNHDESFVVRFQAYLPREKLRRIFFARAYLSFGQRAKLQIEIVDRINDSQ